MLDTEKLFSKSKKQEHVFYRQAFVNFLYSLGYSKKMIARILKFHPNSSSIRNMIENHRYDISVNEYYRKIYEKIKQQKEEIEDYIESISKN